MTVTNAMRAEKSWVQKKPDVCGGDACLRDTRIPVWSVVVAQRLGASEKDLLTYFVTPLTPADVETAFAYFAENPEEIEQEIRLNQEA